MQTKHTPDSPDHKLSDNYSCCIPINKLKYQLQQEASDAEWSGDLERCDRLLKELQTIVEYELATSSKWYPLF